MTRTRGIAAAAAVFLIATGVSAVLYRYPWVVPVVGAHLAPNERVPADRTVHLIVTVVDHFEPRTLDHLTRWEASYRRIAADHRDADGRPPRHTWFWSYDAERPEYSREVLRRLSRMMFDGLGEVELRFDHPEESGPEMSARVAGALQMAAGFGAMIVPGSPPRAAFGIVHGRWALDNSRAGFCGVNDELRRLAAAGCYADFTGPSGGRMHADRVNEPYYATDDPEAPKSFRDGTPMRVGGAPRGDLLVFPGPSRLRLRGWRVIYDRGDVSARHPATGERLASWIETAVQVAGRPEWVFVRPYMHGGHPANLETAAGDRRDALHTTLERDFADGVRYRLHYMTAREAYNVAKAAEAGMDGDPDAYRDFAVPAYVGTWLASEHPVRIASAAPGRVALSPGAPGEPMTIAIDGVDPMLSGGETLAQTTEDGRTRLRIRAAGEGPVTIAFTPTGGR